MREPEAVLVGAGEIELIVLPDAGARMHSLRVRGTELLRRPDDPAEHLRDPFFWGGYVMAPWCNRIAPGPAQIGDRTIDLRPNFQDGTAIHGQVYAAAWSRTGSSSFAIEAEGNGWPWRYRVEMDYAIDGLRLSITQRLHNLSDEAMPGGIGLHPWFPTPVEVRVDSDRGYASNSDSSAQPEPVSGDMDLRRRRALAAGVDGAWADPGDPPLELWWPASGLHATVRAPFPTLHIVGAYAPERGAIAVEPETHAPQGLRRLLNGEPGAMTMLEPGETMTLPITIDFDTSP